MRPPSRILLPITPAVPFARLMRRAVWLARHCGAHLVLLHVGSPIWDIEDQVPQDVPVTRLPCTGDVLHQIMATARSHDIDLIMMPLHEKWRAPSQPQSESDFLSFARGSVVARVIEESRCPVWVDAGPDVAEDAVLKPLCYLNLQAPSAGILAQASQFAHVLGVRLTVGHATFSTDIHAPGSASLTAGMWQESFARTAAGQFARLQREVGTDADLVIENGEPLAVLPRLADKTEANLLMVGHWSPNERWRRGHQRNDESDVFRIIYYSRIPVLIFKAGDPPGARHDGVVQNRHRPVRDVIILLPLVIIFIVVVIVAVLKNHPSLTH